MQTKENIILTLDRDGQCKLILKEDKLRWYTMSRNVAGITYTTYIDPSQVNSDNCVLTESQGNVTTRNFEHSSIKKITPQGNCRKECENISGMFNLTLTPKN